MSAGCNDITSPLLHFGSRDGCPSTCTAMHSKQLESIRCADVSAGDPKLRALAAAYIHQFNASVRLGFAVNFSKSGCAAVENPTVKALPGAWTNNVPNCEWATPNVKTILTLCPVTCRCAQKEGSIQCPTSCLSNPAHLG